MLLKFPFNYSLDKLICIEILYSAWLVSSVTRDSITRGYRKYNTQNHFQ